LCVERLDPEKLPGVDLKGWEIAFCGAEPIRSGTVEQFLTRFGQRTGSLHVRENSPVAIRYSADKLPHRLSVYLR